MKSIVTQIDSSIKLPDGRSLGYVECGDPEGRPVFYFHGWPGSRLEARLVDGEAAQAGVRIIGVDRPGMGLADFQPKRRILDWPDDVVALADALGIGRFAVLGISGGGPFAAACAYKIPERLDACGIIAGTGPVDLENTGMKKSNRMIFFMARRLPWLLRLLLWFSLARHAHDKDKLGELVSKSLHQLPQPDKDLMQDPTVSDCFIQTGIQAFKQGTKGPAHEGKLYAQFWGFKLEDITFDKVYLWHGELDANVPVAIGRLVADAIPNCRAKFYPHDAHLSTLVNNLGEIMDTMLS